VEGNGRSVLCCSLKGNDEARCVLWSGMTFRVALMGAASLILACGDDVVADFDGGADFDAARPDVRVPGPPDDGCGSVRLTSYAVFARGWCEFDTDFSFLPRFAQEGLTAAIGEPWNGSSYEGEPGEACGECWEITTVNGSEVVMIADLCPSVGNELCSGDHFHIDLTVDAAQAVGGGGLDEGSARRVACPVDGNIHVLVNDDNLTYLRIALMNHRIPIRTVEFRGAGPGVVGANEWTPGRRSGGAWELIGGDTTTDRGGTGVELRLTSSQGQVVESIVNVPSHPPSGTTMNLEVQFDDMGPGGGGSCEYTPPGDVYIDEWGGITGAEWQINPWAEAETGFYGETSDGCFEGSCLEVATLGQFSGFHLYYRQAFPIEVFSRASLRVRTRSGAAELSIAPSNDGERCAEMGITVGDEWTEVMIDVSAACGGFSQLNGISIGSNGSETVSLLVDDVRFLP
jgi:hypothetical protein